MDVQKIGALIAELRKEKGMTQKELAECLRVSDRAVSKWERGLNLPNAELFEPLCDELGISVMELLRGERNPDEQISVLEAENVVSAAAELARMKERRAKWLRRSCILLACVALVAGIWLIRNYLEIRAEQKFEQEMFAQPSFWPKVTIENREPTGMTEIINSVTGAVYFEGQPERTLETAKLAVNQPEEELGWWRTRTIEMDDLSGFGSVYFSVYGEKKDMEILVYRWPRALQETDATIHDGELVSYEAAGGRDKGKWFMKVERNYVYSIIVMWEGKYFAEFPFKTESVYE